MAEEPAGHAGFVLAWHAATYYREMRDRQLRATELESLLHQSQLEALRSQLNPHFLFNTLHSIAELVHSNPRLAEQLIVRLGELLRHGNRRRARNSRWQKSSSSFCGYVEIEQMRLGERLRVIWDIQPEALDLVPSLIRRWSKTRFSTVSRRARSGTLTVRARRADGQLQIEVADTGLASRPGIPAGHGASVWRTRRPVCGTCMANARLST